MGLKKFIVFLIAYAITHAYAAPHFRLMLENRSDRAVTLGFQQGVGNVYLKPEISPQTPPLAPHQSSLKYEIYIEPLDANSTFHILFKGQQACRFTVGFFGPGNPRIDIAGAGCAGGGYEVINPKSRVDGYLKLFVSDINLSQHAKK